MPRNVVTAFASATSGAVLTALAISRLQQWAWVAHIEEVNVKHLATLDLGRAAKDKRITPTRRREAADEYDKRDKKGANNPTFYESHRSCSRA